MEIELKMPKMGESITEGTIINWLINEGDAFDEGDILLEVATDKVDNEVPAPVSGVLIKTLFQAKDVVPVGEVIAVLEASGEQKPKADEPKAKTEQPKKKVAKAKAPKLASTATAAVVNASNGNTFFSPLIIAIAKEHHISFEELARIPATGNDGRLRKSDVFNYIDEGRPYKFAQTVVQDD